MHSNGNRAKAWGALRSDRKPRSLMLWFGIVSLIYGEARLVKFKRAQSELKFATLKNSNITLPFEMLYL
jgi:hypothetical protein